jgi:aspartyl aminopeptidase
MKSRRRTAAIMVLLTWFGLDGRSSKSNVHALAAPPMPPLTLTTTASVTEPFLPLAREAMTYFDASTDPFHAVQSSIDLLHTAGFQAYSGGVIQPGGKYYYTRNKSTLVAFCVGPQWNERQELPWGFKIIGGHTDSPNLRVKPRSRRRAADCIQIGVECYGGGLWHTWFDRDLGLSGRVLVRNSSSNRIEQRLVQIDRALLRISNLAIHLQTAKEREAFEVNKEDHLSPILALEAKKALTVSSTGSTASDEESEKENNNDNNNNNKDGWTEHQEPALLQILAAELNCAVQDIVDFELCLFDVQKAALGGAFSEFVHSARLDNLASCFMAVQALRHHASSSDWLETDRDVSMIVLYDHEEVGSTSAVGAASPILGEAVQRITAALLNGSGSENNNSMSAMNDLHEACLRNSFVLSSDQAHAVHPNYVAKHEKNHQPKMNQGMVIKRNSNQRYATTPLTGVLMREVARRANLPPLQEFIVRQDCGCGSTIGPAISAATGIRTIDMGCPQLSMHSIRETMGVCDLTNGLNLFKAFFAHFREVDSSVEQ